MINRRPDLLSRQQVVSLSQSTCVSPVELTDGKRGGGGGQGAKSFESEKAWPYINHSILSAACTYTVLYICMACTAHQDSSISMYSDVHTNIVRMLSEEELRELQCFFVSYVAVRYISVSKYI
jgi:hypothetical protein